MFSHLSRHTVDPSVLSREEQELFADALYQAHARTFDGVSRDAFARYVVFAPAHRTRILVVSDRSGVFRGYTAFHVYLATFGGKAYGIVRMEAGVDPALRRKALSVPFVIRELVRTLLRHRDRKLLFVASFVHPSAYVIFDRCAPDLWPRRGVPTPPEVSAMLPQLAALFGMEPAATPGTYRIGWITRASRPPRELSPSARFFIEHNPSYTSGDGLLTIVPIDLGRFVRGLATLLRNRVRRALAPQRRRVPDKSARLE